MKIHCSVHPVAFTFPPRTEDWARNPETFSAGHRSPGWRRRAWAASAGTRPPSAGCPWAAGIGWRARRSDPENAWKPATREIRETRTGSGCSRPPAVTLGRCSRPPRSASTGETRRRIRTRQAENCWLLQAQSQMLLNFYIFGAESPYSCFWWVGVPCEVLT